MALERLAGELDRAQKITHQAASDCQTYQQQLTTASQEAAQHTQDAQNLSAQAALAAHPHAQAQLNQQARTAADQAQVAQGEANRARDQFEHAQKQGRDAERAYQQQAEQITAQIQAAAAEIRTIPRLPGGAPIPITIAPADINLAKKMLGGAGNLANAAKAATNPSLLRRLAGGNLTPAVVAAFLRSLQIAEQNAPKPQQGSIIDGFGGLVNGLTLGAVSFGNPNTARYRGGNLAAAIPIDPESLIVDGEKGIARLAEDGTPIKDLLASGEAPDRGGLTATGRALDKHQGEGAFPAATGNPAARNALGQQQLKDILSTPGTREEAVTSGNFAGGTRYIAPDGRGATFDSSGQFRYFGVYPPTQ